MVDSRGIGYVAVANDRTIYVLDNIATRSGLVRADRAIFPNVGAFETNGPARPQAIFLWE